MKTGRFATLIETAKADHADEIASTLAAADDYNFFDLPYTDAERDAVEAHVISTFGGADAMANYVAAAEKAGLARFENAEELLAHLDAQAAEKDECASSK